MGLGIGFWVFMLFLY